MAPTLAPGRLEVIREFLNTVDFERPGDPQVQKLAGWCAKSGVCSHLNEEELSRLAAFREALRAVAQSNAGHGSAEQAWRELGPFAEHTTFSLRLNPEGGPELRPQGAGAEGAIAGLLAIVYDAVGAGTWQRLKACRKSSCRWAFFDRSKNGSGAWCNMAVCGNREKAQRRRDRQKKPKNYA